MRYLSFLLAVLIAIFPLQVLADDARVVLVSPPSGEELTGKDIEIAVSYNSQTSEKVTYIELLIDGKRYAGKYLESPQSRGICSFLWDSTSCANGAHSLIVKVFAGDKLLGSVSGSANIGNKPVDVIAPSVNYYGIKSGETVSGSREIKLQAKDNSGKPPIVSVSVDKNLKLIKNTPPYNFAWNTKEYNNGQHVVEAWGYDESGNRGDAGKLTLVVKNSEKPAAVAVNTGEVKESATEFINSKSTSGPVLPAISAPAKPEAARATTGLAALPEIAPGLSAPVIQTPSEPSTSIVVERTVETLTQPTAPMKPVASARVTSPDIASNSSGADAKDSGISPKESIDMALAVPSIDSVVKQIESGASVSLPHVSPNTNVVSGELRSIQMIDGSASIIGSLEPSVNKTGEIVAMVSPVEGNAPIDPLDIPTRSTAPQIKLPAPEMMAMRSSSINFESPLIETSPTRPALPVMTPQTASVKSASADLKGLENGIEAGMRMIIPSAGMDGVKVARLPETGSKAALKAKAVKTSSPAKKAPKIIKGTVKLVLDDGTIVLTQEKGKDGVPAAALRKIAEQLGGIVIFDKDTKTVTAYKHGMRVSMKIGQPVAKVNGKRVKMSCPVAISDDQLFADLKFLRKVFKMNLDYDPDTGEFALTSK